jgi:hypothetical protein
MSSLPPSHQQIVENLDLMLRARYPPIYIVGAEEEPIDRFSLVQSRSALKWNFALIAKVI